MLNAVYNVTDSLHEQWFFSECGIARINYEDGFMSGDEIVYVYYHPTKNQSIMTIFEGDTWGVMGSCAGFRGKIEL
jgi:hypothetical protein